MVNNSNYYVVGFFYCACSLIYECPTTTKSCIHGNLETSGTIHLVKVKHVLYCLKYQALTQ